MNDEYLVIARKGNYRWFITAKPVSRKEASAVAISYIMGHVEGRPNMKGVITEVLQVVERQGALPYK